VSRRRSTAIAESINVLARTISLQSAGKSTVIEEALLFWRHCPAKG
jgi:hypothetical protein